jgi:hypothetical protein
LHPAVPCLWISFLLQGWEGHVGGLPARLPLAPYSAAAVIHSRQPQAPLFPAAPGSRPSCCPWPPPPARGAANYSLPGLHRALCAFEVGAEALPGHAAPSNCHFPPAPGRLLVAKLPLDFPAGCWRNYSAAESRRQNLCFYGV